MHHGWHGTHRHDIQVLATHASTPVHRYSSLLQWSVPFRSARSNGNGRTNTFAYFARNARCTVTTDLLVWYSSTQNDFSPGAAISSLHTLASPRGRNANYDEKQLTGWGKKNQLFLLSVRFSCNTFLQSRSTLWNALYMNQRESNPGVYRRSTTPNWDIEHFSRRVKTFST